MYYVIKDYSVNAILSAYRGHPPSLFDEPTFLFQNLQFAQASGFQSHGRRNLLLQRVRLRGPSQKLDGSLGGLASIGPPEYAGCWGQRVCLTWSNALDCHRIGETQLMRGFGDQLGDFPKGLFRSALLSTSVCHIQICGKLTSCGPPPTK